jgi:hypothetical protein
VQRIFSTCGENGWKWLFSPVALFSFGFAAFASLGKRFAQQQHVIMKWVVFLNTPRFEICDTQNCKTLFLGMCSPLSYWLPFRMYPIHNWGDLWTAYCTVSTVVWQVIQELFTSCRKGPWRGGVETSFAAHMAFHLPLILSSKAWNRTRPGEDFSILLCCYWQRGKLLV